MIPYLTEEQRELREVLRTFLARKSPLTEARRLMASAEVHDPGLWKQMAEGLGLQGLGIAEEFGGTGRTYVEVCLVLEELGYALTCSPFFATAVAAVALQEVEASPAVAEVLTGIAAGEMIATVCLADGSGRWTSGPHHVTAAGSDAEGWALTGASRHAIDAHLADRLIVAAAVEGQATLFLVDRAAGGLHVDRKATLDQTRPLSDVSFDGVHGVRLSTIGAEEIIGHVLDLAAVLLAAEQLGGARRALDLSVAYAQTRIQFGRPIGSFQAIKHRCADMHIKVEGARSLVFYASRLAESEVRSEVPAVASMTAAFCGDAFFEVAAETIQIHGGIGFTWEHDAHLFFKRATASRMMLGDPSAHRDHLVTRAGLDEAPTAAGAL